MRRYLLAFLLAFAVSYLLLGGVALSGFFLYFLDDPPLLFYILGGIAIALPFPALGRFFSRRSNAARFSKEWRGMLILFAVMVLLSALDTAELSIPFLITPGQGIGASLHGCLPELRDMYRWNGIVLDHVFTWIGNLLLPPLFHFGWRRGRSADV